MISSRHLLFRVALSVLTILASFLALPQARGDTRAAGAYDPVMHIQLDRFFAGATSVLISCDSKFVVKDGQGNAIFNGNPGDICRATAGDGAVKLSTGLSDGSEPASGAHLAETFRVVPLTDSPDMSIARIAVAGGVPSWHRYRGDLSIVASGGELEIVDDAPLEEYLCGVLKPEMGSGAPAEALKAQAVAARTYAVRNVGRLFAQGADLDDTTRTQSYLGVDGETPAICLAVSATAGLVMTYDGVPIDAVYSTDCGGETAPGPADEPYLQPVADPNCAEEPSWTKTYSKDELLKALARSPLTAVTGLTSLSIETTDRSGRAAKVKIVGADGEAREVTGAELRLALGTENLRSTLFTITTADDGTITFTGHGWGHGMGMCQEGAVAMASGTDPATYDRILKHYYTGVAIVPLTPALASSVGGPRGSAVHEVSSSATESGGRS